MAKKSKKRTAKPTLADDLRESLEEMRRLARGEETGAVVHRVIPNKAKAQRAAQTLGLIKRGPKAVARALKGQKAS